MLKLHGMPISNFFGIVKHVLLEQNIPFEEVVTRPNQTPEFLAISPMGKIPVLETEAGFLTETNVILEYLAETYPASNLFPSDAFERAKVRQLIKTVELYLELPAHKVVMSLFGMAVSDEQRTEAKAAMQQGLPALQRLAKFSPWICGATFTVADVFVFHALGVVFEVGAKLFDWNVAAEVPGLKTWYDAVAQRPISKQLAAETQAALQIMMQQAGRQ